MKVVDIQRLKNGVGKLKCDECKDNYFEWTIKAKLKGKNVYIRKCHKCYMK